MIEKFNTVEDAIQAFVEGAKINHAGRELHDNRMVIRGLSRTLESTAFIDRHSPNARDALIPLLRHDDDGVQVTAASALLQSHPDIAVATLQHIADTSVTGAHITAGMILSCKEIFGDYTLSLSAPDPRYPKPQEKPSKQNEARDSLRNNDDR